MASEDLPWFLTHPKDLSSYAFTRKWEPYIAETGEGRYQFVRDLQNATRNQGKVVHYYDTVKQRDCAVKVVPSHVVRQFVKRKDTENPLVDNGTLRFMTELQHCRHIATWLDCCEDDENMYFVSELGKIGDLFQFVYLKNRMSEQDIKRHIYQILDGVQSLHESNVCHLDISVENVILREGADGSPEALLIDFGMAERLIPTSAALSTSYHTQLPQSHPSYAAVQHRMSKMYNSNDELGSTPNHANSQQLQQIQLQKQEQQDEEEEEILFPPEVPSKGIPPCEHPFLFVHHLLHNNGNNCDTRNNNSKNKSSNSNSSNALDKDDPTEFLFNTAHNSNQQTTKTGNNLNDSSSSNNNNNTNSHNNQQNMDPSSDDYQQNSWLPIFRRKGKSRYQDPVMHALPPTEGFDGAAADIFSVGALIFILLTAPFLQKYPWDSTDIRVCEQFRYFARAGVYKYLDKLMRMYLESNPAVAASLVQQQVERRRLSTSISGNVTVEPLPKIWLEILMHRDSPERMAEIIQLMEEGLAGELLLSREGSDLLQKMLSLDPRERPSAEQCKMHPWFYKDALLADLVRLDVMRYPCFYRCSLLNQHAILTQQQALLDDFHRSATNNETHHDLLVGKSGGNDITPSTSATSHGLPHNTSSSTMTSINNNINNSLINDKLSNSGPPLVQPPTGPLSGLSTEERDRLIEFVKQQGNPPEEFVEDEIKRCKPAFAIVVAQEITHLNAIPSVDDALRALSDQEQKLIEAPHDPRTRVRVSLGIEAPEALREAFDWHLRAIRNASDSIFRRDRLIELRRIRTLVLRFHIGKADFAGRNFSKQLLMATLPLVTINETTAQQLELFHQRVLSSYAQKLAAAQHGDLVRALVVLMAEAVLSGVNAHDLHLLHQQELLAISSSEELQFLRSCLSDQHSLLVALSLRAGEDEANGMSPQDVERMQAQHAVLSQQQDLLTTELSKFPLDLDIGSSNLHNNSNSSGGKPDGGGNNNGNSGDWTSEQSADNKDDNSITNTVPRVVSRQESNVSRAIGENLMHTNSSYLFDFSMSKNDSDKVLNDLKMCKEDSFEFEKQNGESFDETMGVANFFMLPSSTESSKENIILDEMTSTNSNLFLSRNTKINFNDNSGDALLCNGDDYTNKTKDDTELKSSLIFHPLISDNKSNNNNNKTMNVEDNKHQYITDNKISSFCKLIKSTDESFLSPFLPTSAQTPTLKVNNYNPFQSNHGENDDDHIFPHFTEKTKTTSSSLKHNSHLSDKHIITSSDISFAFPKTRTKTISTHFNFNNHNQGNDTTPSKIIQNRNYYSNINSAASLNQINNNNNINNNNKRNATVYSNPSSTSSQWLDSLIRRQLADPIKHFPSHDGDFPQNQLNYNTKDSNSSNNNNNNSKYNIYNVNNNVVKSSSTSSFSNTNPVSAKNHHANEVYSSSSSLKIKNSSDSSSTSLLHIPLMRTWSIRRSSTFNPSNCTDAHDGLENKQFEYVSQGGVSANICKINDALSNVINNNANNNNNNIQYSPVTTTSLDAVRALSITPLQQPFLNRNASTLDKKPLLPYNRALTLQSDFYELRRKAFSSSSLLTMAQFEQLSNKSSPFNSISDPLSMKATIITTTSPSSPVASSVPNSAVVTSVASIASSISSLFSPFLSISKTTPTPTTASSAYSDFINNVNNHQYYERNPNIPNIFHKSADHHSSSNVKNNNNVSGISTILEFVAAPPTIFVDTKWNRLKNTSS